MQFKAIELDNGNTERLKTDPVNPCKPPEACRHPSIARSTFVAEHRASAMSNNRSSLVEELADLFAVAITRLQFSGADELPGTSNIVLHSAGTCLEHAADDTLSVTRGLTVPTGLSKREMR